MLFPHAPGGLPCNAWIPLVAHASRRANAASIDLATSRDGLPRPWSGLGAAEPRRRTFAAGILPFAHCVSAALRPPGFACSHSPPAGLGSPSQSRPVSVPLCGARLQACECGFNRPRDVARWIASPLEWARGCRAPPSDVRCGHPALRSLRVRCASPSGLRLLPQPAGGARQPLAIATRIGAPLWRTPPGARTRHQSTSLPCGARLQACECGINRPRDLLRGTASPRRGQVFRSGFQVRPVSFVGPSPS